MRRTTVSVEETEFFPRQRASACGAAQKSAEPATPSSETNSALQNEPIGTSSEDDFRHICQALDRYDSLGRERGALQKVASEFDIPYHTLWRHATGKTDIQRFRTAGRRPYATDAEAHAAIDVCLERSRRGQGGAMRNELPNALQEAAEASGARRPTKPTRDTIRKARASYYRLTGKRLHDKYAPARNPAELQQGQDRALLETRQSLRASLARKGVLVTTDDGRRCMPAV